MILDKIEEYYRFSLDALDGLYGQFTEAVAILLFVIIFNVLIKWVLKKLQTYYEKQKKVWVYSFFSALYPPFTFFVWAFAVIEICDLILSHLSPLSISLRHLALTALAIIALYWFLMKWKNLIIQHMIIKSKNREFLLDHSKIDAIDKVLTISLTFFTAFILLEATGYSATTLLAFGGIGGLALAFASQEIIANFFGGLMIYINQPFTLGEYIRISEKSIEGTVEEIGWYTTKLRALDRTSIYVPNATFSKLIVTTLSRLSHRLFKQTISVTYDDLNKVKTIAEEIEELLKYHPDVDHNFQVFSQFISFAPYSLDILVQGLITTTDYSAFLKIQQEILLKIAQIVEKNGAVLAAPMQEIRLIQK